MYTKIHKIKSLKSNENHKFFLFLTPSIQAENFLVKIFSISVKNYINLYSFECKNKIFQQIFSISVKNNKIDTKFSRFLLKLNLIIDRNKENLWFLSKIFAVIQKIDSYKSIVKCIEFFDHSHTCLNSSHTCLNSSHTCLVKNSNHINLCDSKE